MSDRSLEDLLDGSRPKTAADESPVASRVRMMVRASRLEAATSEHRRSRLGVGVLASAIGLSALVLTAGHTMILAPTYFHPVSAVEFDMPFDPFTVGGEGSSVSCEATVQFSHLTTDDAEQRVESFISDTDWSWMADRISSRITADLGTHQAFDQFHNAVDDEIESAARASLGNTARAAGSGLTCGPGAR